MKEGRSSLGELCCKTLVAGGAAVTDVLACAAEDESVEACVHYPAANLAHQQIIADKTLFYQALKQLHELLGTQYRVPLVMEKDLDLYLLYKQVAASAASCCGCSFCISSALVGYKKHQPTSMHALCVPHQLLAKSLIICQLTTCNSNLQMIAYMLVILSHDTMQLKA